MKCDERRPGARQQRERDAAQQQQHEQRGDQRGAPEQALAQALPDGVSRLDRSHGIHRGRQPVTACNPRTQKPAAAPSRGSSRRCPRAHSAGAPVPARASPRPGATSASRQRRSPRHALDLRLPGGPHLLDQACRQRHVVELGGHLATVLVRPVEELQRLCGRGRIRRRAVHQDEARAGDGPALRARLVRQDQVVAGGMRPVGIGGGGLEAVRARRHGLAALVDELARTPSCSAWRRRTRRSRSRRRSAWSCWRRPRCPWRRCPTGHCTEVLAPIESLNFGLDLDR